MEECRVAFANIEAQFRGGLAFKPPRLSDEDARIVVRLVQEGNPRAEEVLLHSYLNYFEKVAARFARQYADYGVDEGEVFGVLLDSVVPMAKQFDFENYDSFNAFMSGVVKNRLRGVLDTYRRRSPRIPDGEGGTTTSARSSLDETVPGSDGEGTARVNLIQDRNSVVPSEDRIADSRALQKLDSTITVQELVLKVVGAIPNAPPEKVAKVLRSVIDRRMGGVSRLMSDEEAKVLAAEFDISLDMVRVIDAQTHVAILKSRGIPESMDPFEFYRDLLWRERGMSYPRTNFFIENILETKLEELGLPIDEAHRIIEFTVSDFWRRTNPHLRNDLQDLLFGLLLTKRQYADVKAFSESSGISIERVRHLLTDLRKSLKEGFREAQKIALRNRANVGAVLTSRRIASSLGLKQVPEGEILDFVQDVTDFALQLDGVDKALFEHRIYNSDWPADEIGAYYRMTRSSVGERLERLKNRMRFFLAERGYPSELADEGLDKLYSLVRVEGRVQPPKDLPDSFEQVLLFESVLPELAETAIPAAEQRKIIQDLWVATQIVIMREAPEEQARSVDVLNQAILAEVPRGSSDQLAREIGFATRALRNTRRRRLIGGIRNVYDQIRGQGLTMEDFFLVDLLQKTDIPVTPETLARMRDLVPKVIETMSPEEQIIAWQYVLKGNFSQQLLMDELGWARDKFIEVSTSVRDRILATARTPKENAQAVDLVGRGWRPNFRRTGSAAPELWEEAGRMDELFRFEISPEQGWYAAGHLLDGYKRPAAAKAELVDELALEMALRYLVRGAEIQNKEIYQTIITQGLLSKNLIMSLEEQAALLGTSVSNLVRHKRDIRAAFPDLFARMQERAQHVTRRFEDGSVENMYRNADELRVRMQAEIEVEDFAQTLGVPYSRRSSAILAELIEQARSQFDEVDLFIFEHRILRQDWQFKQIGERTGVNGSSINKRTKRIIKLLQERFEEIFAQPRPNRQGPTPR